MWTGPRQIFENSPEIADKYRRNDEACLLFTCSPPAPYKCQNQKQRWSLFMALFLGQILFYFLWNYFENFLALSTVYLFTSGTTYKCQNQKQHWALFVALFSCVKFCFLFFLWNYFENFLTLFTSSPPVPLQMPESEAADFSLGLACLLQSPYKSCDIRIPY